jgi:hypothetical protein
MKRGEVAQAGRVSTPLSQSLNCPKQSLPCGAFHLIAARPSLATQSSPAQATCQRARQACFWASRVLLHDLHSRQRGRGARRGFLPYLPDFTPTIVSILLNSYCPLLLSSVKTGCLPAWDFSLWLDCYFSDISSLPFIPTA